MSARIGKCAACGGSGYRYVPGPGDERGHAVVRCECWQRRVAAQAQAPLPFKQARRRTRGVRDGKLAAIGGRE